MRPTRAVVQGRRPFSQPQPRPLSATKPLRLRRTAATTVAAAASSSSSPSPSFPDPLPLARSALLRRLLAPGAAAALLLAALPPPPALAADSSSSSFPRPLTEEELAAARRALAVAAPKPKAPVLLRLVFHDAGTFDASAGDGGANASVRLELERPENGGLKRGWRVIEGLRAELEKQDKKTTSKSGDANAPPSLSSLLSDADLIALAGAHAVEVTGGPADLLARVRVGRADATKPDPEDRLPSENTQPAELIAAFEQKSLSAQEMVALSGAHTLGSKGFGDPLTFDNAYYTTLLQKPWEDPRTQMPEMIGLASDRALPGDEGCLRLIQGYASDKGLFYRDFSEAYLKLTELGARWR